MSAAAVATSETATPPVLSPTTTGPIAQLNEDEASTRERLASEREQSMWVAQLSEIVLSEGLARVSTEEEEDAWRAGPMVAEALTSLNEALRLSRLESQLQSLLDEDEKLRLIVESREVLHAFMVRTTADIDASRETLAAESAHLSEARHKLSQTVSLLQVLPQPDHAALDAALFNLEAIVSGAAAAAATEDGDADAGVTSINVYDGDDGDHVVGPTSRPQLIEAWRAVCADDDLNSADTSGVNTATAATNALSRCETIRSRQRQMCQSLDALFQNHEAQLLTIADAKQHEEQELLAAFDREWAALSEPRKQLKQVEDEQLYHIRRGTFIKERQVGVSHDELLAKRVKGKHTALCLEKLRVDDDAKVVANEVRDLKRSIEDLKRVADAERAAADAKRAEFTLEHNQVAGVRATLEAENEDLKELKKDLTKVLHFVRLKNKS